jgi:hypothetical protein
LAPLRLCGRSCVYRLKRQHREEFVEGGNYAIAK